MEMGTSRQVWSLGLGILLSASVASAQTAAPSDQPATASAAQQQHDAQVAGATIAEQLVEIARDNLSGPIDDNAVKQSAALIEAATRLSPHESRYVRLLADAKMQLHDTAGEIAAWSAYRKLAPDDRVAQVRLIDLYYSQIETADAQKKYLETLLTRDGIAPEVKSHVATEAARLLLNRSEKDAMAMVDRAIQFYPLPEALALRYQLMPKDAKPTEKLDRLLAIIAVDPVQAEALHSAAELLIHTGLTSEARPFFAAAVDSYRKQGVSPSHGLLLDYVSDLYVSGYDKLAGSWADSVLTGQPDDVDFQFFQLTRLKSAGPDGVPPDDALSRARDALSARWIRLNNKILGLMDAAPDGGQPVQPPDPSAAANKLAQSQPTSPSDRQDLQRMKNAFISTMDDLAWLELYYADKPQDAKQWIDARKLVAPKDNAVAQRLDGWYALKNSKPQEAAQHFGASKGDVLSKLGLIQVATLEGSPNTLEEARQLEQQLVDGHFGGLLDAIVHQALPEASAAASDALPAPPGPPGMPAPAPAPGGPATHPAAHHSADATAMEGLLKKFQPALLDFSNRPENFYSVHLTPLSAKYQYGQPMLAMVSVRNNGPSDLPIGSLGPIQPTIIYEADAMQANPNGPARGFDVLTGRLVLRPQEELDQVIRLDQGPLGAYLQDTISPGLVLVSGQLYTNPVMGQGKVSAGAGGLRAGTDQLLGREVPDLIDSNARHQFYADLQSGPPEVRIVSLDLLGSTSRWMHKHPEDTHAAQLSTEFVTVIDHYTADPVAYVADWARYRAATVNRPDGEKLIKGLSADKDWLVRLLSVMAMRYEPFAIRRQMTASMTSDTDATVKELATATLARLSAPSTQPDSSATTGNDTGTTQLPDKTQ